MQQGWLIRMFKGDRVIWALVVVFMIYSLLAVYSSSVSVAYLKHGGNTTYFLRSQFFMLLLSYLLLQRKELLLDMLTWVPNNQAFLVTLKRLANSK